MVAVGTSPDYLVSKEAISTVLDLHAPDRIKRAIFKALKTAFNFVPG